MSIEILTIEAMKLIIFSTSVFTFSLIVFFYKRPCDSRYSRTISAAALMIGAGQLGNIFSFMHGTLAPTLTQMLMQIGLAIIIGMSRGSVKIAAVKTFTQSRKQGEAIHKRAA